MTESNPLHVQAFNTADVAEQIRATPGGCSTISRCRPGISQAWCHRMQGVEIYEERNDTRVEQNFSAPPGSLAFCFDRSDNALYVLKMGEVASGSHQRTIRKWPWSSARNSFSTMD